MFEVSVGSICSALDTVANSVTILFKNIDLYFL